VGVGSYATPGWLFHFREDMRQGVAGPADVEEAFEDATRVAVADQIEAGLDVICDGELRRMRFVFEMYDRLSGLERTAASRRSHDGSPERSFARWRRERGSCVQASDVEQGSLPSKSGDRP
jgi:methionine synthase II (cobalamin-independent)